MPRPLSLEERVVVRSQIIVYRNELPVVWQRLVDVPPNRVGRVLLSLLGEYEALKAGALVPGAAPNAVGMASRQEGTTPRLTTNPQLEATPAGSQTPVQSELEPRLTQAHSGNAFLDSFDLSELSEFAAGPKQP
ncbi:hypothetical protein [Acidovorax sp. LjRoot118]|uniref:hypothetical protein n=1 Tax=Acidovorax sp. LjRoot118 TaxID=3342256 RepID=UPI003F4F8C58